MPCHSRDAITRTPGVLGNLGQVISALGKPRWPLMCGSSPGNQVSYTVITRHCDVRVSVLPHDLKAKFVVNQWYHSVGVPAVLRDQGSYL